VGSGSYATISGKGDSGLPTPLPDRARRVAACVALPWAAFTLMLYGFAFVGGLVKVWGRDYTPTLDHYAKAFAIEHTADGLIWSGAAWNSFWTTVKLAAIAAPLTAALGLLAAWLLVRQRFAGRATLEFATMLSFAVPGTVIGVAYVFAFNVPPIEITGTAMIIVLCFIFRNMPVGVRAGMAAMSQIDRSLDEASLTLQGRAPQTLLYVVLPLMRPAIVGALVYGFVRAVTTVSAVVFLVTAEYELATTYIILRVINGDYGLAEEYYRRAVEANRESLDAWLGLAATYDRLKRFDLAENSYRVLIAKVGYTPVVLNNLGYHYLLEGKIEEARKYLMQAHQIDPNNPEVLSNIALLDQWATAPGGARR
jgi:iron(III) transport system permease protein